MSHSSDDREIATLDLHEIVEAICAADSSLIAAEASRDLESAMRHIAPNVILQPPDMPMVIGREAVREFYAEWFSLPYKSIHIHSQTVVVASSGELAYLIGESSFVLDGPKQEERHLTGKYLGVWKEQDGHWLLAAISWSGNTAPGAN